MAGPGIKRILLTGDTAGGVWTFTLELAEGLIQQGIDVRLATFGPLVTDSQKYSAANIAGLQWFHHSSKLEWMADPWQDIKSAGDWLWDIGRKHNPDLIHLNTLCHGNLPWKIPVVMTVHSCVASWWAAVKKSPLPAEWLRYTGEVESSLRSATIVTAPSRAALDAIRRFYDVDMSDERAIYNGRSSGLFHIEAKEPFILAAGRLWDEAKNLSVLAGLAPRLSWPVYLAGNAHDPSGRKTTLANCYLLGEMGTSELSEWYARASIYALPARYEPFGLSILEAALSGCALLLGDIPSLREVWQDAATFVSPDDPDALAAAFERLMRDSSHRENMSRRALSRAGDFTRSRMVAGYLSAYQSALAKHGSLKRRHACAS